MKQFWKHLKEHKKLLFLALLLATINQLFSLLDPQIFRIIIDNYATKFSTLPRDVFLQGIILLLLAAMGAAFISRTAKNFQDYFVNVITQKVGTNMYSRAVNHVLSLPYAIFEDQQSGATLQKLQKAKLDTQTIITSAINILFLSAIGMLFVLIYAFTVHWSIGLTYLLSIPFLGGATYIISRKIKDAHQKVIRETTELAGSTTETLRNVELVKSLGLEDQEIKRLNSVNESILGLELKKVKLVRKLSFIQGTLINFTRSVLLFLMLWLIFEQKITLGAFFTLWIYSFFLFGPMGEFGNIASQYQEAKASNEQLNEVLKIPTKKKNKDGKRIARVDNISFDGVGFKYESGSSHSVKGISLSLGKGQTVAFAGPSGAGKSTMIKLLVGLYEPTEGSMRINGVDSKDVDYDHFRRKIGLVSQETQLFAGTIRENLKFVNPKATDKECLDVLRLASVTNLLERGGKGLDTKIGEGGVKISGGERQRLAIARALLRKPEIIIFDEATSSLDSLTEKEITHTIKDITNTRKDMIVVLVAHRLSTIAHADTIYVLEKGRIAEQGSHEDLLRKKGLYYAFWREQVAEEK